jgi:hypothetical protein
MPTVGNNHLQGRQTLYQLESVERGYQYIPISKSPNFDEEFPKTDLNISHNIDLQYQS